MRTWHVQAGVLSFALSLASPVLAAPTAIVNGTVHTVSGGTIANGTVIFDSGVLTAVGAGLAAPAGATVIDAKGANVTPGLINSYTRLGLLEIELVKSTNDTETDSALFSAAFDVAPGINPASALIPITRVKGVTRAIAAPDFGKTNFAGQGALLSLGEGAAFTVRPKVAMYMTVGETGKRLVGGARGAVWAFVRQAFADARYYERNKSDFDENRARATALTRLDLEALLPVLDGKMPLVVDVHRASDIQAVVALAGEYKLKVVLIGAREGWQVAGDIAKANIPVILDPTNNLPGRFEALGATLENAAKLHAAGVKVAIAVMGDQVAYNARSLAYYGGLAVQNGLPKDAALAAITKTPAEIWGMGDKVGTLERGKEADVVIWDNDPLEAGAAPTHVFIKGQAQSLETRQTKLRDRYRNLGAPSELGYR
ncbi:MAG: amidohydrolase family protein [Rhodospirillaceae bacterium]|nr:amidohydrolase family protein [Rhodospirillaceae bacterium]